MDVKGIAGGARTCRRKGVGLLCFCTNMEQKQSGSCLAEIRRIEDKETPSGRSTRASLVKLPKIGVFSSSAKSVSAETPQTQPDGAHEQQTQSSKPPSRQGTEKNSTLTTQQLEIRINLSDVLDSTQAVTSNREETLKREKTPKRQVTPRREETPKRGESSKGVKSNKSAALPAQNDPLIWEQRSVNKTKGERPRTKTWPALQYKLWLDSSNLPLHLLCNDERANRPQHLLLPQMARKSAKSSRPGSSNCSFKSTDHGKSSKDWSMKFLSVSRPPFCPDKKKSDSSALNHKSEEERKRVEEAALLNDLKVGIGESWQVATSYAHRPESRGSKGHESIGRVRSTGGVNLPQVGKGKYPHIPSRMGQNNLEAFLKQTTLGDVFHSYPGESIPGLQPNLSSTPSKLPSAVISPRYFCNTSAEVKLLTLRSYARNPRMLQEPQTESNKNFNPAILHQNKVTKAVEIERDGVRHVRFKVPCGSNEDTCNDVKQIALASKQNSGMRNQILSDVTPPPTPPNLDRAFRISVIPHF